MDSRAARTNDNLVAFSRAGFSAKSAAPSEFSKTEQPYDFISLLAVAQRLNVDFLPITWQPELDKIGVGATSEIRQSLIDLQTSFAFKLFTKPAEDQWSGVRTFHAPISEILILGHPSLRTHPNIVTLQGICWSISPAEIISPVLVFEKAKIGDLRVLMEGDGRESISVDDRLNICRGIAAAVRDMHVHGVIHGDIKPENVLVYKENSDSYTARVTDFGYSTVFNGTGVVYMPISEPWNAPEWHHRGVSLSASMKMDAYSFGMLCLWVVFIERFNSHSLLHTLESGHQPLNLARQLVRSTGSLTEKCRISLDQLFNFTLEENPDDRNGDFVQIARCFGDMQHVAVLPENETRGFASLNADFQILPSISQFYRAEYRLRESIAFALCQRASSDNKAFANMNLPQKAAFQLAFCYRLGFGVPRDTSQSQNVLKQSLKQEGDLQREFDVLKNKQDWSFRRGKFGDFYARGLMNTIEFAHFYHQEGVLQSAYENYRREIADTESVLGDNHEIVGVLKSTLSKILREQGAWSEAEKLQLQVVESERRTLGSESLVLSISIGNLASIYWKQGHLKKAEDLLLHIIEIMKKVLGPEHAISRAGLNNLAANYMEQGRWQEAKELLHKLVSIELQVRGPEHPATLMKMSNLAVCHWHLKESKEAEELIVHVVETRKRVLGLDHPDTHTSMNNLGMNYYVRQKWRESEELYQKLLELNQERLGPEHPITLSTMVNLASTYLHWGRLNECEELNLQALEIRKRVIGEEHASTLLSMDHLAHVRTLLGKLGQAAILRQDVFCIRCKMLGEQHPRTVKSMVLLARLYLQQELWTEAKVLQMRLGETIESLKPGVESRNTLMSINELAVSFRKQGRFEEAISLEVEVMGAARRMFGEENPDTLRVVSNVAAMYKAKGDVANAKAFEQQALDIRRRVLGDQHPETLKSLEFIRALNPVSGLAGPGLLLKSSGGRV